MARTRQARPVGLSTLWFALLGGHTAWTGHLLLGYFLVSLSCLPAPEFRVFGIGGYEFLVILLTVITAALALGATIAGFSAWQKIGTGEWRGVMGFMGMVLSGIFFVTILFQGVPVAYLDPCS